MRSSSRHSNLILAAIIVLAFFIRVYHIEQPLIEGVSGGQTLRATIARNFYRAGDYLTPQTDLMPQPFPVYNEFPLYTWTVAMLYSVVGGVHEWIGRLLSIIFFIGAVIFSYKMIKNILGEKVGIVAVICMCFLPSSIIYSRSFALDTMNLFFSIGMLYYFLLWLESEKSRYFMISLSLAMLCYLTRIITIYMIIPMIYLSYSYRKHRCITQYSFWFYHIASLIPAAMWYRYAQIKMIESYGEKFLGSPGYYHLSYWITPLQNLNYQSLKMLFEYVAGMTLTPIGFSLALLGLLLRSRNRREYLFLTWLLSALAFFILLDQIPALNYYLFLTPPVAVYIGKAIVYLWEKEFYINSYLKYTSVRLMMLILMALLIFGYANSGYKGPQFAQHLPLVAESVRKHSEQDDIIIWHGPAALLYYSDRKGWRFEFDRTWTERWMKLLREGKYTKVDSISCLEMFKELGGKYFVTMYLDSYNQDPEFAEYMASNYKILDFKKGSHIVLDLQNKQ